MFVVVCSKRKNQKTNLRLVGADSLGGLQHYHANPVEEPRSTRRAAFWASENFAHFGGRELFEQVSLLSFEVLVKFGLKFLLLH